MSDLGIALLPLHDFHPLLSPGLLLATAVLATSVTLARRALFPSMIRHHLPKRRRSKTFWFTMFALVGPVWALTPAFWVLSLWRVLAELGHLPWPRQGGAGKTSLEVLTTWAFIEAIFSIYHSIQARSIQAPAPPRTADAVALRSTFLRVLRASMFPSTDATDNMDEVLSQCTNEEEVSLEVSPEDFERLDEDDELAVAFRERLRTWFFHAPWSSVHRENALEWISWSTYNMPLETAIQQPEHKRVLLETLDLLERRTGVVCPEGRNDSIRTIRLTLDRVPTRHRPLILYTLTALINTGCELYYRWLGMQRVTVGGIDYLLRIPAGWTPESRTSSSTPIAYIHGLGFGWLQNHYIIVRILRDLPTHPLLVPVQPHISMQFFDLNHLRPTDQERTVASFVSVCEHYGFWRPAAGTDSKDSAQGGLTVLSHSNGSTTHAWLLKACPALVLRSCFVDPVTFCLWEGDVCFSFIYREPSSAIELLMSYFIASELGIANTISRYFDWAANVLFADDIPHLTDASKTTFFLGGKDAIIHAERVRGYLTAHGVQDGLHFDPKGSHGEALVNGPKLSQVLDWIRGDAVATPVSSS